MSDGDAWSRRRAALLGSVRLPRAKALGDGRRLLARAEEPRIHGTVTGRIADDEHAVVGRRVVDRERMLRLFAACAAASCEWPTGGRHRCPACLLSSSSHGMAAVPVSSSITVAALLPMNGSRSTGTSRLKSVRPICGSVFALLRGCRDQAADERHLRGLRADFAARALGVDRIDDPLFLVLALLYERADEVVVGAAVAGVRRATPRPDPFLDDRTHGEQRG